MEKIKLTALAGSTRKDSVNKKLIQEAVRCLDDENVELKLIDLADYPMPLYDGDLEEREGVPENGKKLKDLFIHHDGLLLCCPEYNSSITGVLKNTIDWISRPEGSDPYYLVAFKGKAAGLMSASPGNLGGLRSLVHVRDILGNIGMQVMANQLSVPNAYDEFDQQQHLKDQKLKEKLEDLVEEFVTFTRKIKREPA